MTSKVYQLKYDSEVDKDIHDWISKLPSNRKAELVRHAIRFYLTATGNNVTPALLINSNQGPVEKVKEPEREKKVRPSLPMDGEF